MLLDEVFELTIEFALEEVLGYVGPVSAILRAPGMAKDRTYNAVLNLVANANISLGNGEVILQPVTLVVIDNLWRRPSDKGWFGEFLVGPGYEPGWIQTQQAAIFALSPDGAISEVLMINRVYLNDIQGIFSNVQNTAFVPTDDGQWVLAPYHNSLRVCPF